VQHFAIGRPPRCCGKSANRQSAEEIQQKFIAHGPRSRDGARQSGKYVSAETVIRRREQMLLNGK